MLLYVHLFLCALSLCLLARRGWGTTHVWPLGGVRVWYMYIVLYTVFVHCTLYMYELVNVQSLVVVYLLKRHYFAMYTETSCLGILMLDNGIELPVHCISS